MMDCGGRRAYTRMLHVASCVPRVCSSGLDRELPVQHRREACRNRHMNCRDTYTYSTIQRFLLVLIKTPHMGVLQSHLPKTSMAESVFRIPIRPCCKVNSDQPSMHTVWAVAMIMGGDVACAEIARSSNTELNIKTSIRYDR